MLGMLQGNLPQTPEELARQREMIAAMMPRFGDAKNIGEGLGQLGTGLVMGLRERKLQGAEREGREGASDMFSRITGRASGSAPMTFGGMSTSQAPASAAGGDAGSIMNAIFQTESSSTLDNPNWGIMGQPLPEGNRNAGARAIGPAQIMTFNIPEWSRRHLGQEISPEQLAAGLQRGDPAMQDAYMRMTEGQVNEYLGQGYSPEEVAIAWHGGPGAVTRYRSGQGSPRDSVFGLPTFGGADSYVSRFSEALGPQSGGQSAPRAAPQGGGDVIRMNANGTRQLPLSEDLSGAMASALAPLGLSFDVFSAGQAPRGSGGPRTGSTRHDHGNAADGFFYQGDRRLDPSNPQDQALISQGIGALRQNGITGIGHGDGYMMPGSFHIGFGNEAVWGGGGSSANAAPWVQEAFYGAQAGAQPSMSAQNAAPMPMMGGGYNGPPLQELYAALSNPWMDQSQRAVLGRMIEQAEQAQDPMRQMQMMQMQQQLAQGNRPDPTSSMQNYQFLVQQGVDPATAMDRAFSGGVTVNTGDQGGMQPELLGTQGLVAIPDPSVPQGYRVEPAPGSPLALEREQAERGRQNTQAEGELKLGTTLESLNLNIAEIEDGGWPVAGAFGDFRRTGVGRALTGNSAVDFGNRNSQITDSAALAEIQRMRDNSPTGGAVGQLTDSERVAIGNAVTALNASTSPEEYTRAAKAYRELALNLAYGEGRWRETAPGTFEAVSEQSQSNQAATQRIVASISGATSAQSIQSMVDALPYDDPSQIPQEVIDAVERRARELGINVREAAQ